MDCIKFYVKYFIDENCEREGADEVFSGWRYEKIKQARDGVMIEEQCLVVLPSCLRILTYHYTDIDYGRFISPPAKVYLVL